MKEMTPLEKYYNKFNEEKRLNSRHGRVEFFVSMHYIQKYLKGQKDAKILDIGAGTGRYSVALANEGYDVTAVELVKYNLGILKSKNSTVKAHLGTALNLKKFADKSFDLTLLFGPMYHLCKKEDKIRALSEAKRVTKEGGYILVAYCMNEYSVITYGFKERHILHCIKEGLIDKNFRVNPKEGELYDYVRIEDIDAINEACNLKREKIIGVDGAADYMRPFLNQLSEEEFEIFLQYQLSVCERYELLGASAHSLDILRK